MVRCILLFALSGGVIKLMGGEYQKAVQSFANQTAVICSEDSLMNYLKRIKQGSGYVVFEDDWTAGEICYFEIEKGRILSANFYSEEKDKECQLSEFSEKCKRPSLLYYKGKVYLNFPRLKIKLEDERTLCEILSKPLASAMDKLSIARPETKLRARIYSPEFGRVDIGDFCLEDIIAKADVQAKVLKQVEDKLYAKWKVEHDKRVKQMPAWPPVKYGDGKQITRDIHGTYVIPHERVSNTRTITWTETVWADGHGTGWTSDGQSVDVNLRIPVGERLRSRTKKISGLPDYDALVARMKGYEAEKSRLEAEKPPSVDEEKIQRIIRNSMLQLSILKTK